MAFSIVLPYLDTLKALPGGDITAFIIIRAVLAVAFDVALSIILKILGFLVGKTKTTLDDRVLKAMSAFLPAISVLTALWISLEAVYPNFELNNKYSDFDLYLNLMLVIIGLMLGAIADAVLIWYGIEIRPSKVKKVRDEEVFPFVRNVVKIAIIIVFVVFVLQRLGFETTAILTGLGVGGLAVALALQDTLGNFFGGVHILVDKPFREEDYIRLESGLEGTVKQIGWRTTRIMTPTQNELIVPNSKLAGSILENYSTPNEMSGVIYSIGVDCREDIDSVEKIMTEALQEVAKKEPLMDPQSIWVRFDSFGDYTLNFKFGYMMRGYVNRFDVLKEVNRGLFYSLKKNGIRIPFPVRVIVKEDKKISRSGSRPSGRVSPSWSSRSPVLGPRPL